MVTTLLAPSASAAICMARSLQTAVSTSLKTSGSGAVPDAPEAKKKAEEEEVPAGELPPAPSITPETEFSGALLRAVRQSQGTSLDQISERTKVGTNYLRCIEQDEFEKLPAAVYVRGFVTEFAKCLRLDPEQVSQSYLRRYKARMEEAGESA
mgnify:CR=1 FL=1